MPVQRLVPLAALGLAVVAAAIILASSGGGGERVTAVFQQAYGLVDGGEVTIAGVPVGSIDRIALGSDGLPHVTMQLDGGVRLHEGVRADLRELSNSGELNRYILLEDPGRGPELPDGAVIPSTQTAEPVEIDQVLNTLDPPTRAAVRSVLASLDSTTVGLAPAFRAALRHSADAFDETAGMLQEVTYDRYALRTMVSSGAAVSTALANARPALAATVDQLSALLSETAARQRALGETIARLPAGLLQPGRALDRLRVALPTLRSFIAASAPAAAELRPAAQELTPVLRRARALLAELAALTAGAPHDLRMFGALVPTLGSTLGRLTPVLRSGLPVLDYLRVYTPDVMGLIANWSATNSSYDAAGHGARILATSNPPPGGSVPPWSDAHGYIASPFLRTPGAAGGNPWKSYASSFLSPVRDR